MKDHHKHMKDDHKHKNYVSDIIHCIAKLQQSKKDPHCMGMVINNSGSSKNTVPFMLYTNNGVPFEATGVYIADPDGKQPKFKTVSTFLFRVNKIDNERAVLELLAFKNDWPRPTAVPTSVPTSVRTSALGPGFQIENENVNDLVRTGVYVNVDLTNFTAVTTLPVVSL
ncbi:hypothetical protein GN156_16310 [bacterium LRH843]|nr:hypothetical protein [bacterium LRH843]